MNSRFHNNVSSFILAVITACTAATTPVSARLTFFRRHQHQQQRLPQTAEHTGWQSSTAQPAPAVNPAPPSSGTPAAPDAGGKQASDEAANPNAPAVVPPPSLIDLTTAKFGKLDIELKSASFLDGSVQDLRLSATNMDMNNGSLDALNIDAVGGEFQDFTVDGLSMSTAGVLNFDTNELLNNKVLQFRQPAEAQVKATVSQTSLNSFINSKEILERLSLSAKKRVPVLSKLARQNVMFGFDFLSGQVQLMPEDHLHLSMAAKVGMGKIKMSVPVAVDTKLTLAGGWVNLADTRLTTNGQLVPPDVSAKIVNRVNSLSKWADISDDIQFHFTDLKVLPDDRLELAGSAIIRRLRLTRSALPAAADNTPKPNQ